MLKKIMDKLTGRVPAGTARSPHWTVVQHATIADHPYCSACRSTKGLEVHHKQPFHLKPELELQNDNLIVLCRRCHQWIGHLDDWKSFNPNVTEDAAVWQIKKLQRKTA